MALPLPMEQYVQVPWQDREYRDLHVQLMRRKGGLLDVLERRHGYTPTLTDAKQINRANCDMIITIPSVDGPAIEYEVELKSEQHESGLTSIELLSNIKRRRFSILQSLGATSLTKAPRSKYPDIFSALEHTIDQYRDQHPGLGVVRVGPNHISSLWRRGPDGGEHRVCQTIKLQAAIMDYLGDDRAMIGVSDSALIVLLDDPFWVREAENAGAFICKDIDIHNYVKVADKKLIEIYRNIAKKKGELAA